MANPTFVAAVVPSLRATAVLMPTMRARASTSGPPELPDEIAASVWISPSRAPPSSVINVRSSAETMPSVTLGSPSRSRAKPMARTWSPSPTSSVGANVTAGRSPTSACRSARSLPTSDATSSASIGSVSPDRRTRTSVAPATTWAFVSTSPAPTTTPVPTARPPSRSALMVTIDGATAATASRTGRPVAPPPDVPGTGSVGVLTMRAPSPSSPIVTPTSTPPTPATTAAIAAAATIGHRRVRAVAPGGLGGRGLTPGAGGGSTGTDRCLSRPGPLPTRARAPT